VILASLPSNLLYVRFFGSAPTLSFNLAQRLYVELTALGHQISIEFDINDSVTTEAVELFKPHLILAPYLRRAIPEAIWRGHVCLVVHPGIVGDRGPSALDWAILNGEKEWGVTVLQAEAEMDAGPVWASETFPTRAAKKSSLYRNEVTEAAVRAVKVALSRLPDFRAGTWQPQSIPLRPMHALMQQGDRAICWERDATATVLAKLNCADGFPGVRDSLFGQTCQLYDGRAFPAQGRPGELLGRAGEGVVRATSDRGPSVPLAVLEVAFSLALFTACALHVRLRLKKPRRRPCPPLTRPTRARNSTGSTASPATATSARG